MLVDFHTHPIAHGSGSYTMDNLLAFMEKAKKEGIAVLGFSDHDRYLERIDFQLRDKLNGLFDDLEVRFGLEVDYFPDKEQQINDMVSQYPFDYVIGSVHYIGDWPFDVAAYIDRYQDWDVDDLYCTYFSILKKAAQAGLFQILGHLDIIKIFGFRPRGDIMQWVDPLLKAVKENDLTVEVNSAGLYKPVQELYPSEKLLVRCFELNIPVTISSDAHEADHVGRNCHQTQSLLKKIGYNQIASFKAKKREMLPL